MYLRRLLHLPHRTERTCRAILAAILLTPWSWAAADTVDAHLSSPTIGAGQPAELILTATSDGTGQGLSRPDLSVLEDSFQVLDRQTQHRVNVTNGRRREQVTLRLLLMPKHAGKLRVPAITFGRARSRPLTLTVEGGSSKDNGPTVQDQGDVPLPDFVIAEDAPPQAPWDTPASGLGMQSQWASQWPSVPWPGNSFAPPGGSSERPALDPPRFDLARQEPEETPASRAAASDREDEWNPWFWTSLVLAVALAASLIKRHREVLPPAGQPTTPQTEPPPDPLAPSVERVREAYRRADAAAARDALLEWGRLHWPENPPNNLSRLAQRLSPPLRDHVTELEKAFFSPRPIQWDLQPVADELGALARGVQAPN